MDSKNNTLEKNPLINTNTENNNIVEKDNTKNENLNNTTNEFHPYNPSTAKKGLDGLAIFGISVVVLSVIVILLTMFYFYTNSQKETIYSGITIKGIDVSNLTKEQAITKITEEIQSKIPEEIILTHDDYKSTISTSALNIDFHIEDAINTAYETGRSGNLLEKNFNIFKLKFSNINIEPYLSLDNDALRKNLEEISANLPDKMIENSYYIEKNNLIITKGKEGKQINIDEMVGLIQNEI